MVQENCHTCGKSYSVSRLVMAMGLQNKCLNCFESELEVIWDIAE